MRICVLYSEELAGATLKYLQAVFPDQLFTNKRHERDDSVEYEYELEHHGAPDERLELDVKACTAHFLNGYRSGIAQCETIVKGDGDAEHAAVQATVDNLS